MTVGQELSRVTGYKFMHNHQTIDLILSVFDYGSPAFQRLLFDFRVSIFEEVAASEIPGFIFSSVPDFNSVLDRGQNECYAAPFLRRGGRVLFVELEASFKTRLDRNLTEHRLHHKPLKRNTEFSEQLLREEEEYRSNSVGVFSYIYPHLKIINEALSPLEVAAQVCAHFELPFSECKERQLSGKGIPNAHATSLKSSANVHLPYS